MSASPATNPVIEPLVYACRKTAVPPRIDGRGDDEVWKQAEWTAEFVDIEGDAKPKPRHRTRVKMLWDDECLYVLAELEEPHVWGTLTERNSIIYNDNDFEVFIDPDGDRLNYYELEVNALNTTMELTLPKPYIDGGKYRFVQLAGLRTAVDVRGTLNDPSDVDGGWTAEIAIPFAGLAELTAGSGRKPAPGDTWRINFSRVQWLHTVESGKYVKVPKDQHPEDNWVWSPQGVVDMHRPERWGYLVFRK
jgi:hypothetical protein